MGCRLRLRIILSRMTREADSRHSQGSIFTTTVNGPESKSPSRPSAHGLRKAVGSRLRRIIMCAPDIKAGPQVPNAEPAEACSRHVVVIFPAICPQFLEKLASDLAFDPNVVINCIVDQEEKGSPYPRKPPPSALKRKRSTLDDEAEETARARRIYDAPNCRQRVLTAKHHHQM